MCLVRERRGAQPRSTLRKSVLFFNSEFNPLRPPRTQREKTALFLNMARVGTAPTPPALQAGAPTMAAQRAKIN